MVEGAKILRKHLNPFVQSNELGRQVHAVARGGPGSAEAQLEAKLNMLVNDLKLSVRANNCLESEGIRYVRDLVQRTEDQLLEVRNFGETTLSEVREKLSAIGLHLGMRIPSSMR
jgi:DNA-directed RNA polymerase subunit alpha